MASRYFSRADVPQQTKFTLIFTPCFNIEEPLTHLHTRGIKNKTLVLTNIGRIVVFRIPGLSQDWPDHNGFGLAMEYEVTFSTTTAIWTEIETHAVHLNCVQVRVYHQKKGKPFAIGPIIFGGKKVPGKKGHKKRVIIPTHVHLTGVTGFQPTAKYTPHHNTILVDVKVSYIIISADYE